MCGCGLDVAPSTKQNHLKGKGTTALRARVFAETILLIVGNINVGSTRIQDPKSGLLPILMREASANSSNPLNLSQAQSPMFLQSFK